MSLSLQIVGKLTDMLDVYMKCVDETPPIQQPQRFGNKAYRQWSDRVSDVSLTHAEVSFFHTPTHRHTLVSLSLSHTLVSISASL